jgi:hypothetical protein
MEEDWSAVDVADEAAVLRYCAKEIIAIERACKYADAGFVTWDATPPSGYHWQSHKFSFLDAVQTGLAFCDTDLTHEWLLIGRGLLPIVRTLPQLVEHYKGGEFSVDVTFLGELGRTKVWYSRAIPPCDFYMGCGHRAARGQVQNLPGVLGRPRPVAEQMDREMGQR